MINALPAADKVTVNDAVAINDANRAYAELTEDEKGKVGVTLKQKLDDDSYALIQAFLVEFIGIADDLLDEFAGGVDSL